MSTSQKKYERVPMGKLLKATSMLQKHLETPGPKAIAVKVGISRATVYRLRQMLLDAS